MHTAKRIAFLLVIIGGLNWGLYGVANGTNLVELAFGEYPMVGNVIYVLIGLSALFMLVKRHKACCCSCKTCDAGDHCDGCCVQGSASSPVGPSSTPKV